MRTKIPSLQQQVDAIFCADIHLRSDKPICRTDDFDSAQWKKMKFLKDLQKQYSCPVVCSGDLMHHWKPSPELITKTIANLPKSFCMVYGQHDLPTHSLELAPKCGTYTLATGKHLTILEGTHFGQEPKPVSIGGKQILVWHKMVWHKEMPWPGCTDPNVEALMDKYPQYETVVTGDNHIPFAINYKGRLLVNPGSMMRQKSDQVDHKPRVYLWNARSNTVTPVFIPIQKGVVSREHIEKTQERDGRIDAFISRLDEDWETDVDFIENLDRFELKNKIRKSVMNIIRKALEKKDGISS